MNHQLGDNRNRRHQLERDLANKDSAINIGIIYFLKNEISVFLTVFWWTYLTDHTCHQMKNTSRNINIHGGVEKLDPNISIPETWAENSNRNIQDSQGKYSLFLLKNHSCPPTLSLYSSYIFSYSFYIFSLRLYPCKVCFHPIR